MCTDSRENIGKLRARFLKSTNATAIVVFVNFPGYATFLARTPQEDIRDYTLFLQGDPHHHLLHPGILQLSLQVNRAFVFVCIFHISSWPSIVFTTSKTRKCVRPFCLLLKIVSNVSFFYIFLFLKVVGTVCIFFQVMMIFVGWCQNTIIFKNHFFCYFDRCDDENICQALAAGTYDVPFLHLNGMRFLSGGMDN